MRAVCYLVFPALVALVTLAIFPGRVEHLIEFFAMSCIVGEGLYQLVLKGCGHK